jgi:dynactin complex subunit
VVSKQGVAKTFKRKYWAHWSWRELTRRRVLKAPHRTLEDVDDALATLEASGEIEIETNQRRGAIIKLKGKLIKKALYLS